jgi:hypothetical protein
VAYTIQFKPLALRQLEKLPRDIQKRLAAKIEPLRDEPFPAGCPGKWKACWMSGDSESEIIGSFTEYIAGFC